MIKQLVVAMSVLGFVSCPVFAATDADAKAKPKHHHHRHHPKRAKQQLIEQEEVVEQPAIIVPPPPAVCTISQDYMIINRMTQSLADSTSQGIGLGRAMPTACDSPGWFNRIQISGGVNVDLAKFGNRNGNFMGENYQRVSLNDAYLNVAAVINDWTKAFASISYNTATINSGRIRHINRFGLVGFNPRLPFFFRAPNAEYSAAYSNNARGGTTNALQLEQAYVTFSNFDMSPVFIQVGKQYQDFSRYEIHPMTRSLTQVISETLATSAKVGFIANGFNGSLYTFDDPLPKFFRTTTTTNYGAALGYDHPGDQWGIDFGAGYLYNMIGVNDVAFIVNQFNGGHGYRNRVSAVAAYADLNIGPFVLGARFTTATQRFRFLDLPRHGNVFILRNGIPFNARGAKPWAGAATAAYGYNMWGKDQNVYLGYQTSNEAGSLQIPKYRWLVGYAIQIAGKNTDLGFEWDHDNAYGRREGGRGNGTNLVTARAAVKFS